MKWIKRISLVLLVLAPAGLILFGWLSFRLYLVPTSSMEPAVLTGDRVITRVSGQTAPRRGEIVVVRANGSMFTRRIVAIAGDHVRIHEKKLYINGREQREDYVVHVDPRMVPLRDEFPTDPKRGFSQNPEWIDFVRSSALAGEIVVPSASSFALGDNRDNSFDSRYLGFVRDDQLVGRPVMVLFSVEKRGDQSSGAFRWDRLFKIL